MVTTINKDFLKNYRFSDNANAWILGANSFFHPAELLLQVLRKPKRENPSIFSMTEVTHEYMYLKTVCYLYAIAIELFLKGLYSKTKTPEDQESTESFKHDTVRLNHKLITKGILKKNELDKGTLEVANVILEWSGRYHKPNADVVDKVIKSYFEEIPDEPGMVRPKFNTNIETATKLGHIAKQLSDKTPINPASIDNLHFLPF